MANDTKKLHKAKANKYDEFYTRLEDIENELKYYKDFFKGKTVLCNCDDPRESNFFHYFAYSFEHLGLKKLITTCYKSKNMDLFSQNDSKQAVYLEYEGDKNGNKIPDAEEIGVKPLKGDGDFRSDECIELLKQADVVVTNPPFSLLREYIAQLMKYEKKFLIIGDKNAITYKEIFPLIRDNKIWLGKSVHSGEVLFKVTDEYYNTFKDKCKIDNNGNKCKGMGIRWFTNIEYSKRHEELELYKKYSPCDYPKYNNYDVIEVGSTADIPMDYDGVMGVPITFIDKYNSKQFEIIGMAEDNGKGYSGELSKWDGLNPHCIVNGVTKFKRIFIKRKK